ncbi:hypothetical protein [Halioxenophilus sp. WMMB6]|uniref:hypothetical protein n=1 Tax=Halioxenophilus sp. WMMB6 TaxID=3073815 RepID=UPI00295EC9A3|nr:hypothetical protein [Halioxenophilus sp. WMMB6]
MQEICPNPLVWNKVYLALKRKWIETGCSGNQPPKPLVIDLWAFSSDHEKAERWKATLAWALEHRCYSEVSCISAKEMYSVANAV